MFSNIGIFTYVRPFEEMLVLEYNVNCLYLTSVKFYVPLSFGVFYAMGILPSIN